MRAGGLKHIITIQEPQRAVDAYGGDYLTWTDFLANIRARKRTLRGRELIAAQAVQSETEVVFYIRYVSGINSSMRIVHGSEYYDITGVVNVNEANRELEITAKTGTSEG